MLNFSGFWSVEENSNLREFCRRHIHISCNVSLALTIVIEAMQKDNVSFKCHNNASERSFYHVYYSNEIFDFYYRTCIVSTLSHRKKLLPVFCIWITKIMFSYLIATKKYYQAYLIFYTNKFLLFDILNKYCYLIFLKTNIAHIIHSWDLIA